MRLHATRDYSKCDMQGINLIKSGHIKYTIVNTLYNTSAVTRKLLAGNIFIDGLSMYKVTPDVFKKITNGDGHPITR